MIMTDDRTHVLEVLLVRFKEWDDAVIERTVSELGGTIIGKIPPTRWARVRIPEGTASALYPAYWGHPAVEDVEFPQPMAKQSVGPAFYSPNDNLVTIAHQLHLQRMDVFQAWQITRGAGVKVGNADGGLNGFERTLEDFSQTQILSYNSFYRTEQFYSLPDPENPGNMLGPFDVVAGPSDDHSVAGMSQIAAAGNDGQGMSGVAPEVDAIFFGTDQERKIVWQAIGKSGSPGDWDSSGYPQIFMDAYSLYGVKLFYCSWAIAVANNTAQTIPVATWLSQNAYFVTNMQWLRDQGVLVIFAAGNEGICSEDGLYTYPGFAASAVGHLSTGVTGYDEVDQLCTYSCTGPEVEIATPGDANVAVSPRTSTSYALGGIINPANVDPIGQGVTLYSEGRYSVRYTGFNGTSSAAPVAAGAAALIWSAYPGLTGRQVRQLLLDTGDRGQNPEFARRLPWAVVPNAGRGTRKAKSMDPVNVGAIYPYIHFQHNNAQYRFDTGKPVLHIYGSVACSLEAFSSDPITSIELWAGADDLVYRWQAGQTPVDRDHMISIAAARFAGKNLRVIASTATNSVTQEYTDIIGHALDNTAAPRTAVSPVDGSYPLGYPMVLSVLSDNPPATTYYRWDSGPWQVYSGPIPLQSGTLSFYSKDCFGNVEGGVDYANL